MKKYILFIFIYMITISENFSENLIPYAKVVIVKELFTDYFNESDSNKIDLLKDNITKSIGTEYKKAWNEYYANRENIKNINPNQSANCIRKAIDDLPTKLNASSQNPVWIFFGFNDEDYKIIYDRLGLKGKLKPNEYNGDEDGNGRFYGNGPRIIYIFNAYKDYKHMIFQTEKNGCIYKRLIPHMIYNWIDKLDANLITRIQKILFYFGEILTELKDWHILENILLH